MPPKKHRIYLVDDHPIVRQGLSLLLNQEADMTVCGTAPDVHTALGELPKLKPHIVVTDLSMPGADGLELIKNLRALSPKTPVLVLSMLDETLYAERVLKAGARGYIMKHEAETNIMTAIRSILRGDIYLSPSMTTHFLHKLNKKDPDLGESAVEVLGDRELQVFRMIGRGNCTREIAKNLGIGIKTVETHMLRIRQKLGYRNYSELACQAAIWVQQEDNT